MSQHERMLVFAGSYAEAATTGLYTYALDTNEGTLTLLDAVGGLQNPTFLQVDETKQRLYVITEQLGDNGARMGAAAAFAYDRPSGKLTELNRNATVPAQTCHIQCDRTERYAVVSSYSGGHIGLIALTEDGHIGALLDLHQHAGSSVHERQAAPHPHSAFFSPDEQFVFIPDLGLDEIKRYRFHRETGKLEPCGGAAVPPGAGPRHMAFHPNGTYACVINELDSTISSFRYNPADGHLEPLDHVSTLPAGFTGESWCAEIRFSADGRFVYGSNRGDDSIAVFAVDTENETLTLVQHVSTEGAHPRHFNLTPDGAWMIVANRDTNNITTFRVDPQAGTLTYSGHSTTAAKPVCVQPIAVQA